MESKLQRKIIKELTKRGWLVNKIIRCSRAGWPDIEAIKNGRVVFIEVKDEGKEPTILQQHIHDLLRNESMETYVVDTFEEFKELKL